MLYNPVLTQKLEQIGIAKFLTIDDVAEIAINQPLEIIVLLSSIGKWQSIEAPNATTENLEYLGQLIANINGLNLDKENPIMSAQLPTGERIQFCTPPATFEYISLNIRRYTNNVKTLEELAQQGTFDNFTWLHYTDYSNIDLDSLNRIDRQLIQYLNNKNIIDFFKLAILNYKNISIAGATASGKTFFTKALINQIPTYERIITIEDVHELFLTQHSNKIHFMFGGNREYLTAKKALASCMRSTPDRIILAEIRGDEAADYIESLNTGHAGGITSVHANDAILACEPPLTKVIGFLLHSVVP
jgi:type IV secretion system protein VirB11